MRARIKRTAATLHCRSQLIVHRFGLVQNHSDFWQNLGSVSSFKSH